MPTCLNGLRSLVRPATRRSPTHRAAAPVCASCRRSNSCVEALSPTGCQLPTYRKLKRHPKLISACIIQWRINRVLGARIMNWPPGRGTANKLPVTKLAALRRLHRPAADASGPPDLVGHRPKIGLRPGHHVALLHPVHQRAEMCRQLLPQPRLRRQRDLHVAIPRRPPLGDRAA